MDSPLEHVIPPERPDPMSKFGWHDSELQKWVKNAVLMQDRHVADNGNTLLFEYKHSEFDAIQLRISIILFGRKGPSAENKDTKNLPQGTPKSMLKTYSNAERKRAQELQKKISKHSDPKDLVYMNHVYVSAAFPHEKSYGASENPVFVIGKARKFMDAGGRVYENWNEYLRNNHLKQGVMMYPEEGNYTPKEVDGKPKAKVSLVASETQSCKPSAVIKEYLDMTVMGVGLALTATAVVTMVPLGIFAASTMAAISTGSYYIGLACTAYTVSTGVYDKLRHDENIATELLLVGTAAFSAVTAYMNQSWSKTMAQSVGRMDSWDDAAAGISRFQKFTFASLNMIKIGMSLSSVASALWQVWMKKNRTAYDYYQLCISLFFFANVVTKPVFLKGVFESEQGKYIQNNIRSRVERKEAVKELDKAVKEAKTTQQKTYLIRNLQKIEDLDGHFYRVHETGSVVQYTEKGLVVNNQIKLSPEAYNQMGKEQLLQKLNDIKHYPTEMERNERINRLVKDYGDENLRPFAEDYVRGDMSDEQRAAFDRKINDMGVRRKDQFFSDTARFKDAPEYQESARRFEAGHADGKTLEAWKHEQTQLDKAREDGRISEAQYNQRKAVISAGTARAEEARKFRKYVDRYVQNSELDRGNLVDEYVRDRAGGKTAAEWQTEKNKLDEKFRLKTDVNVNPNAPDQAKEVERARRAQNLCNSQQGYANVEAEYRSEKAQLETNRVTAVQMADEGNRKFDAVLDDPWVIENRKLCQMQTNYERNERFLFNATENNTKSTIEEMFGVLDYRDAEVNGQKIFKHLDVNASDELNCILNSSSEDKMERIKIAMELARRPDCHMTVTNAREFGLLVTATQHVDGNVRVPRGRQVQLEDKVNHALQQINTMYDSAANVQLQDGQMQFTSTHSAAIHAEKHKAEWGAGTTTQDYLTTHAAAVIDPDHATGSVYTQNGRGISTNYGVTEDGRYRFGVSISNVDGTNPRIVTVFEASKAGVAPAGANAVP